MQQDRARLGRYVLARRFELGWSERRSFAEAIGLSEKTIGRLERGEHVGPAVFANIERFLGWQPGDCDVITRGGKPTETPRTSGTSQPDAVITAIADLVRILGPEETKRYLYSLVDRTSEHEPRNGTASGA